MRSRILSADHRRGRLDLIRHRVSCSFSEGSAAIGFRKSRLGRHCDIKEEQLLSNGQVFEHVVLCDNFDCKTKDTCQEQAFAHRAVHERRRGLVDREVTVQEMHALTEHALNHVVREDEHL